MTALQQDFLGKRRIWISSSTTDNPVSAALVRMMIVELCRYIFAADGTIAYGGDLRTGGLTFSFYEAALRHFPNAGERRDALVHVLPQQGYMTKSAAEIVALERQIAPVGRLVLIDARGRSQEIASLRPRAVSAAKAAASVDHMRNFLASECDGMIAIGGHIPTDVSQSGVAREVALFGSTNKPIFLIPGFGGVVSVLQQRSTQTWLSAADARRLQTSASMQEVITLVLRGFRQAFGRNS